jgi:hypothetical protein
MLPDSSNELEYPKSMEIADAIKRDLDTTSSELAGVEKKISDLVAKRDVLAKKKPLSKTPTKYMLGNPQLPSRAPPPLRPTPPDLLPRPKRTFFLLP